ncbi:MAG TPA: ATP-binding protein [Candidatus Polarisedimenticolaceae bacterium]|nr:ATP-binding protein [Candidatus Polarisedimenticolaceae bacterium]
MDDAATSVGPSLGLLRGIVDGMRCGILAVDRDGQLLMVNRIALQILELDAAPPVATPVADALREFPLVTRVLGESFDMTSLPNRAELDLRPGDPRSKTIGFTLSIIPGEPGERDPVGTAMFFKDLTQIEHKEEQDRLKDRLAALGQMAASLAHEIRNPLAAIEVTCKLLQRRLASQNGGDEKSFDLLTKITGEVRRLNGTITSSLEFVRPLELRTAHAELNALLDEALHVARQRAGKPGIDVRCDFATDMPRFLMDPRQLRQVFENLLINAMEAIDGRGVIRVETEMRPAPSATSIPYPMGDDRGNDPWNRFEHFAVVRIADSGPGIGSEERDRVFYPFFTTKKHGSGVGLSMAKKIVSSHHGLIDVADAPEGGALFTVRLPMVLDRAEV